MFFVYPGNDLKPISSVRWENLRFGIQDFEIFKCLEQKGYNNKNIIYKRLIDLLGKKEEIKVLNDFNIKMDYSLSYEKYMKIKVKLLEKLL